jgi:hypothetical protein
LVIFLSILARIDCQFLIKPESIGPTDMCFGAKLSKRTLKNPLQGLGDELKLMRPGSRQLHRITSCGTRFEFASKSEHSA